MCLGGPNHCRVGRAGSQSYLLSLIVVNACSYCVRPMSSCCVHLACVLFVVGLLVSA
jgi:hypothetical protein